MNEKFLVGLAEALESDGELSLDGDAVLAHFENWDSMAIISIIALADIEFGRPVTGTQISECETVSDLHALVCG